MPDHPPTHRKRDFGGRALLQQQLVFAVEQEHRKRAVQQAARLPRLKPAADIGGAAVGGHAAWQLGRSGQHVCCAPALASTCCPARDAATVPAVPARLGPLPRPHASGAHRCDWYLLACPVIRSCSSTRMHSSLIISSSCVALPAAWQQHAACGCVGARRVGWVAARFGSGSGGPQRGLRALAWWHQVRKRCRCAAGLGPVRAAATPAAANSPSHVDSRCRCCCCCWAPAGGCWGVPRCGSVMVAATESRCTPPAVRPCWSGSSWSSRALSEGGAQHQARIYARGAAQGRGVVRF